MKLSKQTLPVKKPSVAERADAAAEFAIMFVGIVGLVIVLVAGLSYLGNCL
jgi:hypothetical protein